jgi:hypothetical protein
VVNQVIYSRVLPTIVINAAGMPAQEDFLVVGPGAKLKVYVPMTGAAASAAGVKALPVAGVQGGWRDVQTPVGASAVDSVPIISEAQVLKAYEQVAPFVMLNTPPTDATSSTVISDTLNYWEHGVSNVQSELIPVYSLRVEYFQGADSLGKDFAYIPANPTYMRPYAQILTGPTAPVKVGQQVVLTAADASKTLTQLGYDASLNFALGVAPYLYEWFVDSISDANKIGGGSSPSITYKVKPSPNEKGGSYKQTIILRVTDDSSDQRNSTANYALDIYPRVMLPFNSKQ